MASSSTLLPLVLAGLLVGTSLAQQSATQPPLSLAKKAEIFAYDLKARFVCDGQVSPKLKLPTAKRPFVAFNMPDNAYMTGIYAGMLTMQFKTTGDLAARQELSEALKALNLLCTVSGVRGLLARAAVKVDAPFDDDGEWIVSADGKYKWRTDVSTDQMDGVMFGYGLACNVADAAEKAIIARNVTDMVDYILKNGMTILDYNGKPTVWGRYARGGRVSMAFLQHLKVAYHVTGDERWAREYDRLAREFTNAPQTRSTSRSTSRASGEVNYSSHVLRWLIYLPLLELEKDPSLRQTYLAGLGRFWEGGDGFPGKKPEGNPLFAFMVCKYLGQKDGLAPAIETLRLFPLDMKYNQATLEALEKKFGFAYDPAPVSPEPKEGQVVPIDRRPKIWSAWVQNPYEAGSRTKASGMEFTGLDYLLAYWYGRSLGYISAGE